MAERERICCTFGSRKKNQSEYTPMTQRFETDTGGAEIVSYVVFPGIALHIYSVHTDCFWFDQKMQGHVLEIHHCREGGMEQRYEGGTAYILPGDLSVTVKRDCQNEYRFPLSHYHGISINIDLEAVPECLSCFLDDVNVRPAELARRLCGEKACFVIRSEEHVEHIFSELYSVPEVCKKGYYKVKILELLLVLGNFYPKPDEAAVGSLSNIQEEIAKKASVWIAEHLDRHMTVAELSAMLHVSQTHLQNAFKGMYGVPVSSYIRIAKMQSAAKRLIQTDTAVLEIAAEFGYSNAGKFASAFCRVMGETPGDYRKTHSAARRRNAHAPDMDIDKSVELELFSV